MDDLIQWHSEIPTLRRPVLLVALEGFVDAGAVSASASMFLRHRWRSDLIATFDGDALIDYRARRPTAVVDAGEVRRIDWPALELHAARTEGDRDVALLLGPEPDMRWEAFCDAVVAGCRRMGVTEVLTLGAYPAAVPHTRPVSLVQAGNSLTPDLQPHASPIRGYTGPVGVATALQRVLADHGIPAVGLWAEIPHYIAGAPNPSGALAMVRVVASALGTKVDTTELEAAAKLHREQVDEAVSEHAEAAEMITALEHHVDAGGPDEDLPTGEDLAAEIERFLRSQGD